MEEHFSTAEHEQTHAQLHKSLTSLTEIQTILLKGSMCRQRCMQEGKCTTIRLQVLKASLKDIKWSGEIGEGESQGAPPPSDVTNGEKATHLCF